MLNLHHLPASLVPPAAPAPRNWFPELQVVHIAHRSLCIKLVSSFTAYLSALNVYCRHVCFTLFVAPPYLSAASPSPATEDFGLVEDSLGGLPPAHDP